MSKRRKKLVFSVKPHYTPGSPGWVEEHLALRVASEELAEYTRAISGRYGNNAADEAQQRGLGGIVEQLEENRKGWEVTDLLTGEVFQRY